MSKGSRVSDGERGSAALRMARAERKTQKCEWRVLSVRRRNNISI